MSEHSILDELKAPGAFGAGLGGALFGLRWLFTFVAGRFDRRQAALDAEHAALDHGWQAYRHDLEQRLQAAEARIQAYDEKWKQATTSIAELEGLLAAERHRHNNTRQLFEAMIWLLERAREKAGEHLSHIKELRTALITAEAAEKGALRGAIAAAAGGEGTAEPAVEAA